MTTTTPLHEAVLHAALTGLTTPKKTLTPWLFYDEPGSQLFEQITELPEYYLTRTERALFAAHAEDILQTTTTPGVAAGFSPRESAPTHPGFSPGLSRAMVTIAELGAGSASKTGILLKAAVAQQAEVLYQPIDVSPTALDEASATLTAIPGLTIHPQVANYITDPYTITRQPNHRILALYIGSSIGNFSPPEATEILRNLRTQLLPGDALLLGVDLAPSPHKPVATLLAAYDDAAGITAAFNKNILARLNRDLDANFDLTAFAHRARWNAPASRIEMHLESLRPQTVHIEGHRIDFAPGETIHTENSYKFTTKAVEELLKSADFVVERIFQDLAGSFAVALGRAV